MTLEKLFPKYRNQVVLRPEWGLDLFYFCFNHLAISAILPRSDIGQLLYPLTRHLKKK